MDFNLMSSNQTENKTSKQKKYKKIFSIKTSKTSSLQTPSNKALSMVNLGDFPIGSVTIIILQILNQEISLMRNKTNYLDCHLQWEMTASHQLKIRSNLLHKNMKNPDFLKIFRPSNLYTLILL